MIIYIYTNVYLYTYIYIFKCKNPILILTAYSIIIIKVVKVTNRKENNAEISKVHSEDFLYSHLTIDNSISICSVFYSYSCISTHIIITLQEWKMLF